MKKKLLSMLLTLCMVLSLLPTAALAAGADLYAPTHIYVGGTDVAAGGYWKSDGDGGITADGASESDYTVYCQAATGTTLPELTLKGANITKTYTVTGDTNPASGSQYGIYADGSLTIVLEDENTVDLSAVTATGTLAANCAAVRAETSDGLHANITFSGTGSGAFTAGTAKGGSSWGIKAENMITFLGSVTVTATGGKAQYSNNMSGVSDGIAVYDNNYTVKVGGDSKVTASGGNGGGYPNGYGIHGGLIAAGGEVTALCNSPSNSTLRGALSVKPQQIAEGYTSQASTVAAGTNPETYAESSNSTYSYVHFKPGGKAGADVTYGPALLRYDSYSITLNETTISGENPGGQTVEYGITRDTKAEPTKWQSGTVFNGLIPNTNYYAWARSAATDTYAAGTAKAGGQACKTSAEVTSPYNLYVGGIAVTDNNKADILGTSADYPPVKYDSTTNTLTLGGSGAVTLPGSYTDRRAAESQVAYEIYGIYCKGSLTVALSGVDVNIVTENPDLISRGIYVTGELTFVDGGGALNVTASGKEAYGISTGSTDKPLTLAGRDIKVTATAYSGPAAAISAKAGIRIDCTALTAVVDSPDASAQCAAIHPGGSTQTTTIIEHPSDPDGIAGIVAKSLNATGNGKAIYGELVIPEGYIVTAKPNANGTGEDCKDGPTDYWCKYAKLEPKPFVKVTDITDVPTTATVGVPLPLTGTVVPSNATVQEIKWNIKDAGTTGAKINDDGALTTTAAGTVTVYSKVPNGVMEGNKYDFNKEFTITVNEAQSEFVAVTGITGVPTTATVGTDLTLTGTVAPTDATNQTIAWSVKDAGTTGATVNGSTLSATAAGTVTVTATITNGLTASSNYTQDFTITVSAAEPSPVYGISLTPSGNHTFAEAAAGYGEQMALTITVANTGNQATGKLTVALSGTDSGSFTLSKTSIESIAANGSDIFTVVPNIGLTAGTYTATVTVSGGNSISQSFNVSFNVKAQEPAGTAPTITTTSLSGGTVGEQYSQTLAATGDAPITWSISGGTLPAGLTLSGDAISGTPTTAGTSKFTVKAENEAGNDTRELSITIATPESTVSSVTVSPETVTVKKGGTQQFIASVEGTNDPAQTVTWTLEGDHHNDTTISDGLLTVAAGETAQTLTVKAASTVDDAKSGTATVTVTDQEVVRYTLTVTGGSGSGDYPEGSEITVTAPSQDGKRFKEWTAAGVTLDNAAANPITITMPAGNVTLTAVYDALYSVTVTTDGNGSGVASPAEAAEGDTVTISATANSGYQFKEWQVISGDASLADTSADSTSFAMPGRVVDVKAVFEAQSEPPEPTIYTITFDANGGSVTPASAKTGENGRLSSLPAPSRSGSYRFDGWFTASSGGAEVTTATVFTGDATIYAHWTYTGGGSSGGGGGSSSTDKKTEKNPDGSTTTTVTDKKTGTVTETTKAPDGTKEVLETQKDGTVTATVTTPDGTTAQVVAKPDGSMASTEERKDGTKVTSETTTQGKTTATVAVPKGAEKVTVLIPTPEMPKTGEVAVIIKPDGSREVVKTSVATEDGLQITLAEGARLELVDNSKDFADVPAGNWAADPVTFVSSRELFVGTAQDQFSPEQEMSRAMIVTVLARLDGADTAGGAIWYEKSMNWAVEQGLSDGSKPDAAITREELAMMLYRYAGSPEVTGTDLGEFTDAADASGYAADALRWAVAQGILQGNGGNLMPQGTATRAQVAAMFQRYIESTVK